MPPWLILLAILALTLALAYQLFSRRYGRRVLLYWVLVFAALLGAEALAESAGLEVTRIGDLRLLPDLAGGFGVLGALWYLGL